MSSIENFVKLQEREMVTVAMVIGDGDEFE